MTSDRCRIRRVAVAVAALLVAGCGTTVRTGSTSTSMGSGLDAPESAVMADGTLSGAGLQAQGGERPSVAAGGRSVGKGASSPQGAAGVGGTTVSGSGPASDAATGDGFGVTSTTISVAGVYAPDASSYNEALGTSDLDPGDTRAAQQAVADYINVHGGVAGRKIRMVWHPVDPARSRSQNEQESCSAFTEDDKVFVLGAGTEITNECARRARALGLTNGIMGQTSAVLSRYPSIVNITGFTVDRAMRATINGLSERGYFAKTAKFGVVTWDGSDYAYGVTHGVRPALAALGVKAEVALIPVPEAYGNLGPTSAAISNAVLKFRSQGITHVVLLDGAAGTIGPGYLVLEWMHNAESQQWRPTYGLNSNSGFSTMAPNLPTQQMVGSVGVGWVPIADQTPADQEKWMQRPQAQLCLKIMRDAGQPSNSNNQKTLQFYYCDFFFFLKHALDRVKGPLNLTTAMVALNAVGTSYPVLSTFGAEITANKHDGATLVRTMAYEPACTCYRYTSPPHKVA